MYSSDGLQEKDSRLVGEPRDQSQRDDHRHQRKNQHNVNWPTHRTSTRRVRRDHLGAFERVVVRRRHNIVEFDCVDAIRLL
jgi:hypothetical protein